MALRRAGTALTCLLAFLGAGGPIRAETIPDVTGRANEAAAALRRNLELLSSRDPAIRLSGLNEIARSKNPALIEAAVSAALNSEDKAVRALGLRIAFSQVRSLVAKLETPVPTTSESQAVVLACGNSVQYAIEKYNYETAGFEVRGQDHVGVGNVSGDTISMTIEYGCSFTAILQPDGSLAGLVSAPYKKGALPARAALR